MINNLLCLKARVKKRSKINGGKINICIDALINIIRDRLIASNPICISNFGTLCLKQANTRKAVNVNTKEFMYITPIRIILIPNKGFNEFLNYGANKQLIKKRYIQNSKKFMAENTKNGKPRSLIM